MTALRLAELAHEAGIPAGVFNVVPGFGPVAGKAIGMHKDVDGAFFTGSTEVGKLFLQYSGLSNMKRIGLECGGKSAHIVLDNCSDLEAAAQAAAGAIFFNQGEMCTAGSRLVVHKAVKDKLVERSPNWPKPVARPPPEPRHHHGRFSRRETCPPCAGLCGSRQGRWRPGHRWQQVLQDIGNCYVQPTIFDNVTPSMRIAREEIFGPVLSVITVDSR